MNKFTRTLIYSPPNTKRGGKEEGGCDLDVDKMLAELRLEREQIEEAILTLERLARGRGRRRGRPPAWLKDAATPISGSGDNSVENAGSSLAFVQEPRRRGRPPGSGNKVKQLLAQAMEG